MCVQQRSVASQIEIDGQDDGEQDDCSEDEDQDTILDDPAERKRERDQGKFTQVILCLHRTVNTSNSHMFMCKLNDQPSAGDVLCLTVTMRSACVIFIGILSPVWEHKTHKHVSETATSLYEI